MKDSVCPCKFCGSIENFVQSKGGKSYWVACDHCGAHGPPGESRAEAWSLWTGDEAIRSCDDEQNHDLRPGDHNLYGLYKLVLPSIKAAVDERVMVSMDEIGCIDTAVRQIRTNLSVLVAEAENAGHSPGDDDEAGYLLSEIKTNVDLLTAWEKHKI